MTQNERRRFNKAQKAQRLAEKEARKEAQESHNERAKTQSVLAEHERLPYVRSKTSEKLEDKRAREKAEVARKKAELAKRPEFSARMEALKTEKGDKAKEKASAGANRKDYRPHYVPKDVITGDDLSKKVARFTEKQARQKIGHNLKSKNGKNSVESYAPKFKGDAMRGKANGKGVAVLDRDLIF